MPGLSVQPMPYQRPRRDSNQDKRTSLRGYIKSVDQSSPYDDKSVSISVRVHGQPILALLDTGAKVNVAKHAIEKAVPTRSRPRRVPPR